MLNFKAINIGFVIIINIKNNDFLLIHTYQDLLYMPHPLF